MSETTEATKESREIDWCCGACEAAGHIEPGHFACSMPEIPAGWAITTDCGYTDGGWRAIIEPVKLTALCGPKMIDVQRGVREVTITISTTAETLSGSVMIAPRTDRDHAVGDLMLGAATDGPEWLPESLRRYHHIRGRIEAVAVAVC